MGRIMSEEKIAPTKSNLWTVANSFLAVILLVATLPILPYAWSLISSSESLGTEAIAVGFYLWVMTPLVLLSLIWFVRSRHRGAIILGAASLLNLGLFVAAELPAPTRTFSPLVMPKPAYVCASINSNEPDSPKHYRIELAITSEPPSVAGFISEDEQNRVEVQSNTCTFAGSRIVCEQPGFPAVEIWLAQRTVSGIRSVDRLGLSNIAQIYLRQGDLFEPTGELPYSSSCDPVDIDRANKQIAERFDRRRLLREWYLSMMGKGD